jgi:tetratricopeptide (TPR) repeat protein/tRNA A-37 threonylcarbamoyl transferase component Bud32
MFPADDSLTESDPRLSEAVTSYLEAAEAGLQPDQQQWLARYPDLAAELAEFFNDQDQVDRFVAPLQAVAKATVQTFGDYEILEEIGRGGMGVVYRARQKSLNRLVALKMIRDVALASAEERRRFRREAETAAALDHPQIVPIYEVGQLEGQPYFAMKLLGGASLATAIRQRPRSGTNESETSLTRKEQEEAARLLVVVARAVHYAHQRGVLHRDLKPANILLDEHGQPHVTDFGLARREPGLSGTSFAVQTLPSGQPLGTPAYMSPEQAAGDRKAVSTATDVYGLGTVFYTLLTGSPPFEAPGVLDVLAQVKESPPETPSRRNPRLDRDLETVCLKCLEKEPQRRYGSAEALAEDLEHWLKGEPIKARPISRPQLAWRWCRRKPAAAATLGLGVLGIVALIITTGLALEQRQEAVRQRNTADKQRQRADQHFREAHEAVDKMLARVGDKWLADIPQMTQIRKELLEEALKFYERFAAEEANDPATRQDQGKAYLSIGELQSNLSRPDKAHEAFQKAEVVFEQLTTEFPDRADYWHDLARCYERPGLESLDDPVQSERGSRRALAIRERLVKEHPTEPGYSNELAQNYGGLAFLLERLTRFDEAEQAYRQALRIAESLNSQHKDVADYQKTLAAALDGLGERLRDAGRYTDAEPLLRRALSYQLKLTREFPHDFNYRQSLGYWYWHLGKVLEKIGHARDAEEAFTTAVAIHEQLAVDFPSLPANRTQAAIVRASSLGPLLAQQLRISEAEQAYRQAIETYQKLAVDCPSGFMHKLARVNLGQTYANLAEMLLQIDRRDEAKQVYAQMEAVCRKAAIDFPDVPVNRSNLAECLREQGEILQIDGRLTEAEQMCLQSRDVQEKVVSEWPTEALYRENLALIYLRLAFARTLGGRRAEAASDLRQAVELWDKLIADSPADPKYRDELASFLATFPDEKLRDPRRAVDLIKPVLKQQPEDAQAWLTLGIARCRLGEWKGAIEALNKAVVLRKGGDSNEWFYLTMAQEHLGEKEPARKSYRRAVEWMEKNRPKDPELRRLREEVAKLLQ